MAKQLNVNMSFTADSSQAKKQLQELQTSLNKLMNGSKVNLGLEEEIRSSIKAAAELSTHLTKATNVKTGNLDFAKLDQQMKNSGKTLSEYGQHLRSLGPEGQQAFMQLAQAIASAEIPLRRTSNLAKEFWTTLQNTARWQLSSSVLHGFMGALQSAYGYAQDLNESLNNIRVVTGYSVDNMAEFAKKANSAAKALSTTTTAYTNASLIYYQQGLSDAEVQKRADVTIKLANVSRQSAQEVSDQMTAIWNNFYDGSKSIEHYANVLSALGAATASSTEEIAGGIEKFAGIAQTIGLSYEYAAAALATLTSNTRESEEVVGTALKTIFARMQGLSLGETLGDGTTLNKYSQALATAGINIMDAKGNLKDMDDILSEMGNKWDELNRAQQTALAQTVAGTRQYNQLMALMANWDTGDADSFVANLETATNSSGELDKQAGIYAESWEGARDRVTAAAEKIYQTLLNDEFFIELLNSIEKVLTFVDQLIDNLGGLKGVLIALGAIVTKVFSQQIAQGLTSIVYNMQMATEKGRQKIRQKREDFITEAKDSIPQHGKVYTTDVEKAQQDSLDSQLTLQSQYMQNLERMSDIEQDSIKLLMERTRILREQTVELNKQKETLEDQIDQQVYALQADVKRSGNAWHTKERDGAGDYIKDIKSYLAMETKVSSIDTTKMLSTLSAGPGEDEASEKAYKAATEMLKNYRKQITQVTNSNKAAFEPLTKQLDILASSDDPKKLKKAIADINVELELLIKNSSGEIKEVVDDKQAKEVDRLVASLREKAKVDHEVAESTAAATKAQEQAEDSIKNAQGAQASWADIMVNTANAAMSAASAINMLGTMFDTLSDPDVSGWEKFTTILTTLSMLIPTMISLWGTFKTLLGQETIAKIANVAATIAQAAAEKKLNDTKGSSSSTTKKSIKETVADTKEKIQKTFSEKGKNIKDTWNQNALKSSKSFKQVGHGGYQATGEAAKKYGTKMMSKDAAAKLAGKEALGGLGKMAGGAALIAAGVMVAVGAVKWGMAQFQKYSKAAEEAAKVAESAAQGYEKVAQAYNSFKANISDYKAAKDGLKDLTKGTVEYQEAVMKANEAAAELVSKGDLKLGVDYDIDSDGLIQLNEDSVLKAQQVQQEQLQKAQLNKQIAQQNANEAKTKSDQVNFLRNDVKSTSGIAMNAANIGAATAAGAGAGALIGTGIGTIFPVIGNAVGAAVGAIAGGVIGLTTGLIGTAKSGSATSREQEAMEKLAASQATHGDMSGLTKEDYKIYLKETVGITDPKLIDSLAENRKEAEKLAREMNANSEATKALNKQIAATALSDNKAVQDSEYKDEIVATAGKMVQADKDAARAELDKAGWGTKGINKATKVNDEVRDVFADYAAAAGLTDVEVIDTTGTDKNRKFVYKDADGKEHTVDLETMKDVVAADKASQAADERGTKLAKIYNNFDKQEMAAVNAAVNQNYDKLNVNQIMSGNFGASAQSLGLSADDLKAMGYDSAAAFNSAMAEAQKNAAADWDKTLRTHTSGVDNAMNAIATSTNDNLKNISYSTLKAYGDMLEGFGSKENAETFNSALTNLLSDEELKLSGEDTEAIMQAAAGIDWSQGAIALEQLNGQLYDMGIDITQNSDLWSKFQEAVNNMSFSVVHQNLETMRQTLATIGKLAKDVSFGDVISDEDYKQLTDIDGSLKKDFVMTADGYMYVGEGNLKNKAKDATMSQLTKTKSNNARATAAYNALQEGVFKGEDWTGLIDGTDGDAASAAMATNLMGNADILSALGVDAGYMQELISAMNGSDATAKDAAREKLQALYGDIQALEGNFKAGLYDDQRAEEVAASQMGLDELLEALNSGTISQETYDKFAKVLNKKVAEVEEEEAERYHAINEELDNLNHELNKTSKLKDAAFGADKLKQIDNETKSIKKQIAAQQEYRKEIEANMKADKQKLVDKSYGFTFDAEGTISNYDDIYNKYLAEWNEAQKDNAGGNLTPEEFEAAEKKWNEFKENVSQYEESVNLFQSSEESLMDMQAQLSAANLEKITYKMEYKIEIDNRELQWLDYQLGKIADDFFSRAEAAALMIGTVASDGTLNVGGKLAQTMDNEANYEDAWSSLTTQRASGDINQADYVSGMTTLYDNIMSDLDALNQLDASMMSYYGETVAAASEEMGKLTARMEHHVAVLDHYKNLLSIIGEEANYEAMGVILEGQAHMAANNVEVSTEAYEMWSGEAEKWKEKMEKAVPGSAEFELYQKNWEAAEEKSRESQDKMLSDLAAWAEAEKAILQNTLSSLGKTLEESLTGGLSFDKLSTQMERAQSLQEDYLTTTNQIYETTKMMRTAQQAIDSSSNTVAKEKLKNFITETKSLQEQGKLSQYELDMQQAKYDLLVAEIALEEAQNAKSTVRLQRDSEGNFGYVYTADAGAVNEAQQQFDDAQNALYNKGLEGANDYAQKYNTTMQEMYDTFNQIQQDRLNGAFATEEEYNNAMAEAKEYYYQKLQDYSNLYGVAVSADSNIAAEAWSTDFASMINSTDQWKQDVDSYMAGATEAFTQWAGVVATVKETTGSDINALSGNVKTLTDDHDTLTDAIVSEEDGLLTAMQSELDAVGSLTSAYALYRAELQETIKTLEAYAAAAKNAIAAESGKTTQDNPTNNNNPTNNTSSTPTPTTIGGGSGGNTLSIAGGPNRSHVMVTMAATGGMTTNWGPEGKMMMVHENELILNSDQTNRFFDNLALMESILATIDSYALNQQLSSTLSSPSYAGSGSDVLEQNVKIEASFPGVTDRNEIEEAFNNLVNKASQYANRK